MNEADDVTTESATPTRALSDGNVIPAIGLGTAPLDDDASTEAVVDGLRIGYRLIDTGAIYGNEMGVGRGIRSSEVPRDEISLMTKLRGRDHGYEETLAAFEASRQRLGVESVDLYLIHWPLPRVDRYVESWRAMIQLQADGRVRSIGVSNFTAAHVDRLIDETGVRPVVNQVEVHPRWPQAELRAAMRQRDVQTVCYSPLGRGGDILASAELASIAESHGVSIAQVILRWHVELGLVPLPRASGPQRRRENFEVFQFGLSAGEVERISTLFDPVRTGFDPDEREEL